MAASALADAAALHLGQQLADSLPGGVWPDSAPPTVAEAGPASPWAVVVDAGGTFDYDSGSAVADVELRVTAFAATRAAARALGLAVLAALEDATLSIDGEALLYLRPIGPPAVTLDPERAPKGGDVHRADVTFRGLTDRALS